MSSPRSWLFLFLFTVSKFALFVDAKGGGKGSGSKGSKKGSKSIPQTVAYRSNGKCYNEQHVLITCPYNKSTIITTIVLGAITGLLLLAALVVWYLDRRSRKKGGKSLDAESKPIHDASEGCHSSAPLVDEETYEKDRLEVGEYSSDDENTYYDHSAEKVHKH